MPNNKMERFTQRARRVLSLAQEEAEHLRHNTIDTEHMLLGIMCENHGIGSRVLRDLGLELPRLQAIVEELNASNVANNPNAAELSPAIKRILELSVDEARRIGQAQGLQHYVIDTEHLLLALARHSQGIAIEALKRFGVTPENIRRQTRYVLQGSFSQANQPPTAELARRPERPVQYIGTNSIYLIESMMKKMLDMVGDGKLTVEQANEMLATLQPGLKLNTGMQAWLTTLVNQKEQQDKRHVRVVVANNETGEELFTLTMSLLEGLEKLDQLLLATVPDNQLKSVAFESDTSPIRIEIHVENNKDKPDE